MIKCLVFDLDDTLYYEKMYVLEAFKNVSKYLANKYNEDFLNIYNKCIEILEKYGRGKVFDKLCDYYKFDEDIRLLVNIYRSSKPKLKLYQECEKIFQFANENKLKLAIITDGCSKVQWTKIKALKLENIIEKIIVTDDYGPGFGKPHEKSYNEVLDYYKLKPSECVYIGDNPNKDFIGAKKLGIKTIRIKHNYGDHIYDEVKLEYEAEFIVRNLLDIKQYLKDME